jgi:hypothetical protein
VTHELREPFPDERRRVELVVRECEDLRKIRVRRGRSTRHLVGAPPSRATSRGSGACSRASSTTHQIVLVRSIDFIGRRDRNQNVLREGEKVNVDPIREMQCRKMDQVRQTRLGNKANSFGSETIQSDLR